MSTEIVIAGVGMIPFKKPGQSDSYDVMGENAARAALADAGICFSLIEQAFCGYVYGDSCAGQAALYREEHYGQLLSSCLCSVRITRRAASNYVIANELPSRSMRSC